MVGERDREGCVSEIWHKPTLVVIASGSAANAGQFKRNSSVLIFETVVYHVRKKRMIKTLAQHCEKLVVFFEIANQGGLHAASRALNLSAPTLSHSLKELEAVLSAKLFTRTSKGMRLTEPGMILYEFCQKMFRDMSEVERALQEPSGPAVKRIKVGMISAIAVYLWPRIFALLKDKVDLNVSLTTNRSQVILEALVQKNVDMVISIGQVRHPAVVTRELFRDEFGFFAPRDSAKVIGKEKLKSTSIFYYADAVDEDGRSLRQHMHSWKLRFLDESDVDSFEVILEFIKNGYGIGILPLQLYPSFRDQIQRVKVDGAPARFGAHRFYLSYRNDLEISQKGLDHLVRAAEKAVVQMGKPLNPAS